MATAVYSEPLAQMTDLMLEASTSSSFATAGSESDYHPGAKRGYPGTSSNYITPPLQRKGGAVPATVAVQVAATQRPTVMAVRVVEPRPSSSSRRLPCRLQNLPRLLPSSRRRAHGPWARRLRAGAPASRASCARCAPPNPHAINPTGHHAVVSCYRSRLLSLSVCHHLCRSHHHPAQAKTTATPRPRIACA